MRQTKLTRDSFHVFQANARNALKQSEQVPSVLICAGTGCIAGGAMKIYENIKAECESRGLAVYVGLKHDTDEEKSLHVKMSGCHGFCEMGPLVHIEPMGVMYIHVKPEDCHEILEKTVLGGEVIDRLVYHLDGVGQLAHLDMLLALPRLKAVQWVYGDGKPSARHWMEVYQKIARAGKRNFVIGDVQEVCAQLGGNAYCTVGARTREEGEALLRSLGVPV